MSAALPAFPLRTGVTAAHVPEADTMVIRLRPTRDRGTTLLVALGALVLSAAAVVYFAGQHAILGLRDTYSHLEISRRVVAGESPGITQLGSIWLPVPHVLQALFAWNWTLYRTGLAGSFVSMAAFVACTVLIYKIVRVLTDYRRWPAVVGALVFATNANALYQQSTAMDELTSYCFTLAAVYALIQWAATKQATYVLTASLASMLAMLCRYENWFLGPVYVVCVAVMARRLGYGWRDVRGVTLVMALFGVAISAGSWLLYNWLIFGSPLYFLYGPNSSVDQMAAHQAEPEIGNLPLTLHAYGIAVSADLGLLVVLAATLGLVVFLWRERFGAKSLPVLALITVLPFYVFSLEAGEEPISVPEINGDLFNLRFGLIALLPAAILIGYLVGTVPRGFNTPACIASLLVLATLTAVTVGKHRIVIEAEDEQIVVTQQLPAETGAYLAAHTKGPILLDTINNERVAFPVLDRTMYEGTSGRHGNVWAGALADPAGLGVDVVVMRTTPTDRDKVYLALHGTPKLKAYKLAYHNAAYEIYVRTAPQ
jgi:hypothetical protein